MATRRRYRKKYSKRKRKTKRKSRRVKRKSRRRKKSKMMSNRRSKRRRKKRKNRMNNMNLRYLEIDYCSSSGCHYCNETNYMLKKAGVFDDVNVLKDVTTYEGKPIPGYPHFVSKKTGKSFTGYPRTVENLISKLS